MSHLSTALQRLIEASSGLSQVFFAEQVGLSESQMSRLFSGATPRRSTAAKMCSVLPAEHRAEIAAAYLRDLLPQSARDLVDVVVRASATRTGEPDPGEWAPARLPLTKEQRHALTFLARLVVEDDDANDSILSLVRYIERGAAVAAPAAVSAEQSETVRRLARGAEALAESRKQQAARDSAA